MRRAPAARLLPAAPALIALLILALPLAATPRITIATSASRDTVHPLETIDYTVVVRNAGDTAPNWVRVTNRIPTSAMFVSATPEMELETDSRQVAWMGPIAPGEAKTFRLTFITRRDSAGFRLSDMTEATYGAEYTNAFHDMDIDSPPLTGNALGGRWITNAGLIVIGYLAFMALGMSVVKIVGRRRGGLFTSGWLLIFVSCGFLLFFAFMAHDDYRMKQEFAETRCTVLDSLARFSESSSSKTRGGTWSPDFAVRYAAGGAEQISIGYASESALQFGSPSRTMRALAKLPRGGTAPCWYDPLDPKQVVLTREIGGAYGFALIPLLGIAFALFLIRR